MEKSTKNKSEYNLLIQSDTLVITNSQLSSCLVIPRIIPDEILESHGKIEMSTQMSESMYQHGRRIPFHAIYGIFWLLRGPYLAIVTQSKPIAKVNSNEIRMVTKLELLLIPTQGLPQLNTQQIEDENRYISMLTNDIESHKLHYSFGYDLTHSIQRSAEFIVEDSLAKHQSFVERADHRFFWNKHTCESFLENQLYEWITPMVQAYIEYTPEITVNTTSFKILYISRRSCLRQGTRFTMRGIDDDGNVANFVETEQIVLYADGRRSSIIQIRGSIPLYWSSPVTMKYAPKVYQRGVVEKDSEAFLKHAYELMNLYGRVIMVNLIDQKTEQLKLGDAMAKIIADAATKDAHILAKVRFVWFDFHQKCKNMKWENLQQLIKQVDDDFQDYGFFSQSSTGEILSKQTGAIRTNCMDNLDRTNVVQSLFARRSLLLQLNEKNALQGNVLSSPFTDLEHIFKNMWGNNADAISLFYAGTGALKTDFTRTGKRTKKGALIDGYNSCLRYIKNNWMDGYRQDVLDLLLGRYQVSRSKASPFINTTSKINGLLMKLVMVTALCFVLDTIFAAPSDHSLIVVWVSRWIRCLWYTVLLAAGGFTVIVKKGNSMGQQLVQLPILRPQDGCMTQWKA